MSQSKTPTESIQRPLSARLAAVTGETVSLVGDPMVGKTDVAVDAVREATDSARDALLVSATRGVSHIPVPEGTRALDCTPGASPESEDSVSSPADLTGIGMSASRFLEEADRPVVVVDSLTSLLLYNEREDTFRFLSVLSSQVTHNDGLGVVLVDEEVHDEQTVRTFAPLFDGTVRVKRTPDGVRARGKGIERVPDEWVPARH